MLGYASTTLRLDEFFLRPGDGRKRPQIPARELVRAQVGGHLLRVSSFHGIERLITAGTARGLGSNRIFREDTLAYCNARLEPGGSRKALIGAAKQAKRNKVFRGNVRVGLAIDGTGAGRCGSKSKVASSAARTTMPTATSSATSTS
jgi:cyanophycinase-like exopeptidase